MRIADETTHRILAYVAAARKQGYRLSIKEFDAYAWSPGRLWASRVFSIPSWSEMVKEYKESVLEWLVRLGWLHHEDGDVVGITELGKAVLRELEAKEREIDAPVEVVLDPEDPLSYAQLIGRVASHGKALLADPYFRLDQLLHILHRTSVTRILTSAKGKDGESNRAALATAMATIPVDRDFEIRFNDDFHDRYVIPGQGSVDLIGTSLSGVGKKFSVVCAIQPPVADQIRKTYEELWANAKPLVMEEAPATKPR